LTFRATNRLPLSFVYRLTLVAGVAIAHAICPFGLSASASDVQGTMPVHVAAVGDGVLGQQTHEDLIIVAVDASNLESLDEEIAQTHKLQLVRRLVMSAVGLRIISYRAVDPQPFAELIERLRADSRITSAQLNVVYRPVPPAEPGKRLTSTPPERREHDAPRKRQSSTEPRSSSRAASVGAAYRQEAAKTGEVPPMRIAADVLAGGL
jgi:hypothetical protein